MNSESMNLLSSFGNCSAQKTKITSFSPITSWQTDGETVETVKDIFFGGGVVAPKSLKMVAAAMKLKDTCSFEEKL